MWKPTVPQACFLKVWGTASFYLPQLAQKTKASLLSFSIETEFLGIFANKSWGSTKRCHSNKKNTGTGNRSIERVLNTSIKMRVLEYIQKRISYLQNPPPRPAEQKSSAWQSRPHLLAERPTAKDRTSTARIQRRPLELPKWILLKMTQRKLWTARRKKWEPYFLWPQSPVRYPRSPEPALRTPPHPVLFIKRSTRTVKEIKTFVHCYRTFSTTHVNK